MSDRDIKNFDERLGDQVRNKWDNYERLRIDLSTARDMVLYQIPGEFIAVERSSSENANAEIRLELDSRDELILERGRIIETVFHKFWLTNVNQYDQWLDLIIGRNFRTWKDSTGQYNGQAQQVLNVTYNLANVSIAAAAHACSSAIVKADVNNTQTCWVDFGLAIAAVQNDCYPLDPGEWVKVNIPNTSWINCNFEVANEIAYVLYQS